MIVVYAPLKREYIVDLIDGKAIEGVNFKFVKKEEMRLYFEHDAVNVEQAIKIIKKTIQKSPLGSALFFSVTNE